MRTLACLSFLAAIGTVFWIVISTQRSQQLVVANLDLEVIGDDYRLYFRYAGEDGILHTRDDRFGIRNVYVPERSVVRLRLTSNDYAYLVEVPAAQIYEMAVPNIAFDVEFAAPVLGQHQLLASQMCGYDHPELLGKLIVQTPAEFRDTMTRLSSVPFTTVEQ